MFALFLLALSSVNAIGFDACSRSTSYQLRGTPKGGSSLIPNNLKIAFIGDNNKKILGLVKSEGAELVVHAGDFDYKSDPTLFEKQINDVLGADFPYIASIGNHDVDAWSGYHQNFYNRLVRTGMSLECNGDAGIDFVCSYKGVILLGNAIGTCSYSTSSHVNYIHDSFAKYGSAFKVCHWHKNQHKYQTGGKSDETGYEVLDACRVHGAIVATGHEHSYARTYEMSNFQSFTYDNTRFNPHLTPENGNTHGKSVLWVSGLGGESIRGWESDLEKNPWWAVTASASGCTGCGTSRATSDGAMFCQFHYQGIKNLAHCYFKDTTGHIFDSFNITSEVPDTPTTAVDLPCAAPFIEVPVTRSEDDFSLALNNKVSVSDSRVLSLDDTQRVILRFNNVALKSTDKFMGSWLQVYSHEAGEGEAQILIKAVHNGKMTESQVMWTKEAENWEERTTWVSSDLTELLLEIISKPDWTTGDSIHLVLESLGAPRHFRSVDFGLRYGPTLAYELVSPCDN